MTTVYLAGPMRGLPEFNFPAFFKRAEHLRSCFETVINPAELDALGGFRWEGRSGHENLDEIGFNLKAATIRDVKLIKDCDIIALLPGWEMSRGTLNELSVALIHGVRVVEIDPNQPPGLASLTDVDELTVQKALDDGSPLSTPVIGIAGAKRSGKDTLGKFLEDRGYVRLSFAAAIKDAVVALNPLVNSGGVRFNDVVDSIGLEAAKDEFPEVRRLLQRMGTEVARDQWGDNFWVDLAMRKMDHAMRQAGTQKALFTDVRFPNEAQAIIDAGGMVVKVVRPGTDSTDPHPSERALDEWTFDMVVDNSGTLKDLEDKAEDIYRNAYPQGRGSVDDTSQRPEV